MADLNVPMTVAGPAGQRRSRLLRLLGAAHASVTVEALTDALQEVEPGVTALEVEASLGELQTVGWVTPATWRITPSGLAIFGREASPP